MVGPAASAQSFIADMAHPGRRFLFQMAEIDDRIENERIGTDGFAPVHGVIGKQQHISLTEMRRYNGGMFGDRIAIFEKSR